MTDISAVARLEELSLEEPHFLKPPVGRGRLASRTEPGSTGGFFQLNCGFS